MILTRELNNDSNPRDALKKACIETDQNFIQEQHHMEEAQSADKSGSMANFSSRIDCSGSTAILVLIRHADKHMWIANVGDSRAILSKRGVAFALSNDQKADRPDEADRIRKAGGFVLHKRVMGELAVARALGDMEFKEKGFVFVIADPEVEERTIDDDDEFVLLACDGLFDVMSNQDVVSFIHERLAANSTAQAATMNIVKHAINVLNTRDNVTAVLVQFRSCLASKDNSNQQIQNPSSSTSMPKLVVEAISVETLPEPETIVLRPQPQSLHSASEQHAVNFNIKEVESPSTSC